MALKICLLASTYPRFTGDGSGRFMHSIAGSLAQLGHEVHVLIPYHPAIQPMPGPVRIHPFKYIWPRRWSMMGYAHAMDSDRRLRKAAFVLAPLFFAGGLLKLRQIERRHNFDVVHAHWVIPNGPIGALESRRRGTPFFISLHGSDVFVALNNRGLGRLARASFERADGVTACSPQLQEGALALGANPNTTHLVPWGADPQLFADNEDDNTDQLRRQLNIAADSLVILSLGRLVKKKGIEYLVEAMPSVLDRQPKTILVIAGDGPERTNLEKQAEILGVTTAVRFAGRVAWQQVPAYHRLCDVFAAPSVEDPSGNLDGMPTTILEAMAAGRPVVASRIAGIPLVVHEGETGLLVDQRHSDQLALAIGSLLDAGDRRLEMGQRARQLVEDELNWDQVARRFTALYETTQRPDRVGLEIVDNV